MNSNTNIALLRDDYLEPEGTNLQVLKGEKCEAAAIFKWKDVYYGLFSGCTGWNPNPGRRAMAKDIMENGNSTATLPPTH